MAADSRGQSSKEATPKGKNDVETAPAQEERLTLNENAVIIADLALRATQDNSLKDELLSAKAAYLKDIGLSGIRVSKFKTEISAEIKRIEKIMMASQQSGTMSGATSGTAGTAGSFGTVCGTAASVLTAGSAGTAGAASTPLGGAAMSSTQSGGSTVGSAGTVGSVATVTGTVGSFATGGTAGTAG